MMMMTTLAVLCWSLTSKCRLGNDDGGSQKIINCNYKDEADDDDGDDDSNRSKSNEITNEGGDKNGWSHPAGVF